jgi:8-oxo-dGTP pyrophosphatase MutT (NUDIX family)
MAQSGKRMRACAVCVSRAQLLCVQLRDPSTRIAHLFPPGGAVEPGESAAAAAARETEEETGYRVRVQARAPVVAHSPYTWNGQDFDVTTSFFAAELVDPEARPRLVRDANYVEAAQWIALADVPRALGFNRDILAAVLELLPDQNR